MIGLLGAVGLMTFAGCSATDKEDAASSEDAIQGGEEDTQHKFAVGLSVTSGNASNICSGVLIAPNLVLTAQHCISSASGSTRVDCKDDKFASRPVDVANVKVTTDTKIPGRNSYAVSEIIVPVEQQVCGADVALLVLARNVPASEAKPAAPLVKTPMTSRNAITGKIAAIGYGLSAPNKKDSGTRRIKEKIAIACIPGDSTADCAEKDLSSDSKREFQTVGGVCHGDAGSGAFEQGSLDKKDPVVLGVLSRITMKEGECTDGVYTRTDMYARLIISAAVHAAEKGDYETPRWALPSTGKDAGPIPGEVDLGGSEGDDGAPPADAGTKKKKGIDWGKILDWVDDWLPPLLGSDDGKKRETPSPSTSDAGTDAGADGGTDAGAKAPPPPAPPSGGDVPPGGDRQTEESTGSSSEDEKEEKPKKKDAKAKDDGGCSIGGATSSPAGFGALALLGIAAALRLRRRRGVPTLT
jgi:MYXO-CTERM domain-containing protein